MAGTARRIGRALGSIATGLSTLTVAHRVWFGSICVAYLIFLALIPPFQTNDEDAHWVRMWTVAEGHITCAPVPAAAMDFVTATNYWAVRNRAPFKFANVDAELALFGRQVVARPSGAPCLYIPVSYVIPAALARLISSPFDPAKPSRMIWAFYAARGFNWLLASVAALFFLALAPGVRNLTLLLYSLPMAIQQSISINQESTILFFAFALLVLWWAKPSRTQVLWMLAVITMLAATKPIYLVLLLLWLCALVRLHRADPTFTLKRLIRLLSLAIAPIAIWLLWAIFVVSKPENAHFLPNWVNMPEQVKFLKAHPLTIPKIILIQIKDLFGRDHLRGGWISVMGVLGWAEIEIGNRAYYALLLATVLAGAADFLVDEREASAGSSPGVGGVWWSRGLPLLSFALVIPAIAVAMYIQFNAVGAPYAMGCSGRYLHIPYLALLALGIDWARLRWSGHPRVNRARSIRPWLSWACIGLAWLGVHDAVTAIVGRFYRFG